MSSRKLPFTEEQLEKIAQDFPTPFHIYDEVGIRRTARDVNSVFNWVEPINGHSFINHFAVKATPNPYIMQILAEEGMGADASSGPEVQLSKAVGLKPSSIMFTSNNTPVAEYKEAHNAGATINLDDLSQIDTLQKALDGGFPETISFRYNPGSRKSSGLNELIGFPEDSKYGVPDFQLEQAFVRAKELGAKTFGLHIMTVSNELDAYQHIATARLVFEKAVELSQRLGITFSFINLGGGWGIPYRPGEHAIDYDVLKKGIRAAYQEAIIEQGHPPLRVLAENGRHITGPNGYLVTRVRSIKETYHRFVGVDASMANLMRPAMYDAYHEITVMGKENDEAVLQRVVGSLCENNDHFTGSEAKERELPRMEVGDLIVIHDTGAHGHAMGFNYNGMLRSAELLLKEDGSVSQIRRHETRDDLFATLSFPGL